MAMTLQNGGLIQDENLNVHYNGPSLAGKANNAMNSQRKSGISGRKPLGDLSNSRKPVLNQPSKYQNTKNLSFIDEESGAGKKKNILKGSERPLQKGTRKVLSDISNSGKPNLQGASKKKQNVKLSTVREELLNQNAIFEERFLHNHQNCIKAQNRAMDNDEFLSIVGLDLPKELTISTRKPDSPLKLKEMAEWAFVDQSPKKLYLFGRGRFDSSPPCKSPKSPPMDSFSLWNDTDSMDFTLVKTP